jgi:hypothetical protein
MADTAFREASRMRTYVLIAATVFGAMLTSQGRAAVIDFQGTTPGSWLDQTITYYDEDGFRVSIAADQSENTLFVRDGSNDFLFQQVDAVAIEIKAVGGESFTFTSFQAFSPEPPAILKLTGYKVSGEVIEVETVSSITFAPITLEGDWTNLQKVEIVRIEVEGSIRDVGYDNFNLEIEAAAVPEPTTLTLWGLGVLGCALAARRRASKRLV